jgi:protoporphyrinogen oxidase
VVIGGGMAGLAAADTLRRQGRTVALLEAGPQVGGLARSIRVGGEPIEAYYHHVFPQDTETIELADALGLGADLEWAPGSMAILHDGQAYSFDSPLDLLRFDPLSLPARVRVGLATALQVVRPDGATLDRRAARDEARRWFGDSAYELLWRPMLEAKFGPLADEVVMAWLVARIRQRAGARRAGGDVLGYLRGSLGRLAEAYARSVQDGDVELVTSARVGKLGRDGGGWLVEYTHGDEPATRTADVVVGALAGPVLARLVDLPADYRAKLEAIPYRGIVCLLLELDRPLSPHYWVNVTDRVGMGCVGIIEHTNFVPADRYGGRSLVYLAHYVGREDPAWSASTEELIAAAEPSLRALQPAFEPGWIREVHDSRDPFAQPVPVVGGPMATLPVATGLPGLFHASLAHVYPHDRGVSKAIELGRRVAADADAHLESG